MKPVRRFEDLDAWQEARALTRMVYTLTDLEPFKHDFPLRDQMRRSAISVMGNIAEGYGRGGNKEFVQFLFVAIGSSDEVRSHLYTAYDAGHLTEETMQAAKAQAERVSGLIGGLIRYLSHSGRKGRKFD